MTVKCLTHNHKHLNTRVCQLLDMVGSVWSRNFTVLNLLILCCTRSVDFTAYHRRKTRTYEQVLLCMCRREGCYIKSTEVVTGSLYLAYGTKGKNRLVIGRHLFFCSWQDSWVRLKRPQMYFLLGLFFSLDNVVPIHITASQSVSFQCLPSSVIELPRHLPARCFLTLTTRVPSVFLV